MSSPPEMIDALHPDPAKQSTRMQAARYHAMRTALLAVIPAEAPGVRFTELAERVRPLLGDALGDGSIQWTVTTVKLDLEARGLIERVSGRGPQRLVRCAVD